MAADDVVLQFGAKIDDLIKGVNDVKTKIGELNSTVEKSSSGFNSLSNVISTVFSAAVIAGIEAVIVKLAEFGESTEKTMAVMGLTADQAVQMSAMARLAGTTMDALTNSFGRLYLNVQRSTRDGFNPAAQAMKVLGISASDVMKTHGDAAAMIEILHKALEGTAPSMNRFAAVEALAGRSVANLLFYLSKSDDEWKKNKELIDQAQAGLAAAVPGMSETNARIKVMEFSIASLSARLFTAFKPAIDQTITWITKLAQSITADDIRTGVLFVGNWLITFGTYLAKFFVDLLAMIKRFVADMNASLIDIHVEEGSVADYLITKVMGADTAAKMRDNPIKTKLKEIEDGAKASKDAIDNLAVSLRERLDAAFPKTAPKPGEGGGGDGRQIGEMDFGARQRIQEQTQVLETQLALSKGAFDRQKLIYEFDAENYSTSQMTKVQRTIEAATQYYEVEKATLAKIRDLWPAHSAQWEAANRKLVVASQQATTEILRLNQQAFTALRTEVGGYVDAVSTSWNSSLRGLLAGTTSFSTAMKKVFGDLIIYMIEQIEKKFLFEQAKTVLTKLLFGTEAAAAVTAEGTKTAATETGAAARTATEAAAAEATLPLRIGKFISEITADAALVFGGIFANQAPLLGPAAAVEAAAGQATVLAELANVPKLDVGTNYVAQTGLAMIHQGETIIPAQANTPFTGGGGSTTVNLSINAVDAKSFSSLVRSNPSVFTDLIRKAVRDNRMKLAPQV